MAKTIIRRTDNIYLDAAIEALKQAAEEDESIRHLCMMWHGDNIHLTFNGNVTELTKLIVHVASHNENVCKAVNLASLLLYRSKQKTKSKDDGTDKH